MNRCQDQKLNKLARLNQKIKFLKEANPKAKPVKPEYLNLYATQLQYLRQHGFGNDKLNVKLLYKFNGSTVSVINWIQGRELLLDSKRKLVTDVVAASPSGAVRSSSANLVNTQPPVVFQQQQQPACPGSPMVIFPSGPKV